MLGLLLLILIIGSFVYWYRSAKGGPEENHNYSIDDRFNATRAEQEREIDQILEKINKKGMQSLTTKERAKLEQYSRAHDEHQ